MFDTKKERCYYLKVAKNDRKSSLKTKQNKKRQRNKKEQDKH
jgi:hypothetical protein